jgi:beta-alanine degradation protein BauB
MLQPFRYLGVMLACAAVGGAQVIDNEQVRVLKATEQPHVKTRPHEHKVNRVMIYLNAGRQEFVADGKTTYLEFRAGQPLWSPARGTHTAESMGSEPFTVVEVELKKEGDPKKRAGGPLDPVKVDPKHYRVEFENPQVRVLHVRFAPGESTPVHEHGLNRVVVYLSDQNVEVDTDGKKEVARHKAGDVSWGGTAKHSERNLADTPFEVVVVELKY